MKSLVTVLAELFELTNADALELHSGDREPGMYITREAVRTMQGKSRDGASGDDPAAPTIEVKCGLLSGFGGEEWYGCNKPRGHAGPHKNRSGYSWIVTGDSTQRVTPHMLPQSFFPACGCTLRTEDGRRVYVCPTHAQEP